MSNPRFQHTGVGGMEYEKKEVTWAKGTALENMVCLVNWKKNYSNCRTRVETTGRNGVIKIFLGHYFSNSSHVINLVSYNQHFLME